jgi:hypothetical protein
MAAQPETAALPIQPKKKLHVMIRDAFEEIESEPLDFLLSQLDLTEKNETDVVRAVESGGGGIVPVPEVLKIPESRADYLKTGVTLTRVPRCFQYDTDFFEPIRYYADADDTEWLQRWNATQPFMQISLENLEQVFSVLEFIVKDSCSPEDPKLSRVLLLLPDDAPPLAVVSAIYGHWMERGASKMNGSILKYREYPPNHGGFQAKLQSANRTLMKQRKAMSDVEYLKRLSEKLREIQAERQRAVKLLHRQEESQVRDERFVRKAIKQVQKVNSLWGLLMAPPPRACERSVVPPLEAMTHATLPGPPTAPRFLKWCAKQSP